MDAVDLAIYRQLAHPMTFQWNVRLSYAEIGRQVGIDEETARQRVRRLEEAGIVRAWIVVVNPEIFGRTWIRYDLPPTPPESAAKIEAALAAMDGAHLIFESFGGRFALVAAQAPGGPTERQAQLLAAIAGGPPALTPRASPKPTVDLTPLDWRIVQALRADPRAPYAEIAERVGASERTLRRRVERLTEGRAIFLDVEFDITRVTAVVVSIQVALRDAAPREELLRILAGIDGVIYRQLEGPRPRVTFVSPNVPAAEALRRRVEEAGAGRAEVTLELTMRRVSLRAWLDDEIARRTATPDRP